MNYTVTPRVDGPYAVHARVAASSAGGSFYLEVGGTNATGVISVPATGGWQSWRTIPAGTIAASTPIASFKFVIVSGEFNVHWLVFQTVTGTGAGLPPGWKNQDIGSPGVPGSAAINTNTGAWAVNGGGADIWGTADQFHFAHRDFSGDGTMLARVTGVAATGQYPKAGIMFRQSTNANASYAFVFLGLSSAGFETRDGAGAASVSVGSSDDTPPAWVKLTRTGNSFSGYASADGQTWRLLGTRTIALPAVLKAGLAVSAGNDAALNPATMDNVTWFPAPVVLAAAWSGAQLRLTWPASAVGYTLLSTADLRPPVAWSPVTNLVETAGSNLTVTLPVTSGARFLRLGCL
jgi:hypothetical protein